jgi:hypothetical protein
MGDRKTGMSLLARVVLAFAGILITSVSASATQHLIDQGDNISELAGRLQPGDEIVLMPGKHTGVALKDVSGTAEKPIIIRGLDADHPGPINAFNQMLGVHLQNCKHIHLRDLMVAGAGHTGILIEGGNPQAIEEADIRIKNVRVMRTGTPGNDRDAIRLHGVGNVSIEGCHIEGWISSAIDIVACRKVVIDQCTLRKRDGYATKTGVTIRGGSQEVQVRQTRFDAMGLIGIACGAHSGNDEFRPPLSNEAADDSVIEASDVLVERCHFNMGRTAVAFVHAQNCRFRNNTIVAPREVVVLAASDTKDPRYADSKNITFGANLIEWYSGHLRQLFRTDQSLEMATFKVESNLWWSSVGTKEFNGLGGVPGTEQAPQVTDIDPHLDSEANPTEAAAQAFGKAAP